jgi:hypothetical protein
MLMARPCDSNALDGFRPSSVISGTPSNDNPRWISETSVLRKLPIEKESSATSVFLVLATVPTFFRDGTKTTCSTMV